MKPIIGVTARYLNDGTITFTRVDVRNMNAIMDNGGVPVILATTQDEGIIRAYLEMVDGIYFTGGVDISPLEYGTDPIRELKITTPEHDKFEIMLYKGASQLDMPMLGVCRGAQIMNVASGGTLFQDIYVQRDITNDHNSSGTLGCHKYHKVSVAKGTKLESIFGENELITNSHHHQAVRDLGKGYVITATASDGVIEAIESVELSFSVGVQWHPEEMYNLHPEFNKLYEAFVVASKKRKDQVQAQELTSQDQRGDI